MQKTAIMISESLQNHSIILSTLLSAVDYLASPKMMCTCDIPVNQLPARPSVEPSSVKTTTTTTTVGPLRTTIPTTTTTGAPKPAKSDSFDFFEDIPACKLLQLTRRDIWVIFNLPRSCSFISNLCTFPILFSNSFSGIVILLAVVISIIIMLIVISIVCFRHCW